MGSDAIINFNRLGTRRFEIGVGIGYRDDIGGAMEAVRELFVADPRILTKPAPGVWVESMDTSSVRLVIRAWVHVSDLWETQTAFTRALKERFDVRGIGQPSPQQHEVTMRQAGEAAGGQPKP
ncbi:MAG: mechanosensitive ion channel family protein [Rhodanobacteraceae bacterium]